MEGDVKVASTVVNILKLLNNLANVGVRRRWSSIQLRLHIRNWLRRKRNGVTGSDQDLCWLKFLTSKQDCRSLCDSGNVKNIDMVLRVGGSEWSRPT